MGFIGPEGRRQLKLAGRFLAVGVELAFAIVIGYVAGNWLDGVFGTKPWLMLVGLAFGIAAGFLSFFRTARTAEREASSAHSEPPSDGDARQ